MALNLTERPRRAARDRALLLPPTAREHRKPSLSVRPKGRVVWRRESLVTTWGLSQGTDGLQRAPRPSMPSHTLIGPPAPRPFRRSPTDATGTVCVGPSALLAAS